MNKLFLFLSFIIIANYISAEDKLSNKRLESLAKQGDLVSQIELANAYRNGIGVTQDYRIAVNWFTVIGPLSFSYAIPLSEGTTDITENFRFQIGTSF